MSKLIFHLHFEGEKTIVASTFLKYYDTLVITITFVEEGTLTPGRYAY